MKTIIKLGLIATMILATFAVPQTAGAQTSAQPPAGAIGEQKPHGGGPRKQLATIIFAGLGGAILGLSTLSFYGRPQDYLANIPIGFAIGIIGGTCVVTYRAATNPQELYGSRPELEREFDSPRTQLARFAGPKPTGFNFSFEF